MPKLVWKKLKAADLQKLGQHLDTMPVGERPVYGLVGQKRNELLSWVLVEVNKPHAVIFTHDRVVLSQRSVTGRKEKSRREYPVD